MGQNLCARRIIGGVLWGASQPDHTLALTGLVTKADGNVGRMLAVRAVELAMGCQRRGQTAALGILADLLTDLLGDAGLVQHQIRGLKGAQANADRKSVV